MSTPTLLPCPFCGAAPEFRAWHGGGVIRYIISCVNDDDCDIVLQHSEKTPDEAATVWNRRYDQAASLDARRYRWLRDSAPITAQAMFWHYASRKQRDKAIDEAIAALSKEAGHE